MNNEIKNSKAGINLLDSKKYLILPDWITAIAITLWLILPHISLRYSHFPIISGSYAALILFLFLILGLVVLIRFRIQNNYTAILFSLIAAILYGFILGFIHGKTFFEVAKSGYELLAPAILLFLIILSRISTKCMYRSVIYPLLLVSLLNSIYTIYQYFWVHSYQDLWFYKPLTNMGHELSSWDYEITNASSNGGNTVIRAPGIFTSPLENVYVTSITLIYFAIKTIKSSFIYALPTSFYILIGYMTGVRTFFIGISIAFLAFFLIEIKRIKNPFNLLIVIPLAAIVATYFFLLSNIESIDLSALGRINQLNKVYILLQENPFGYGFGSIGLDKDFLFDSVYGTWFVSLGVIGGVMIVSLYYWLSKQLLNAYELSSSIDDKILLLTLLLFSISLNYVSQFQYALITPGRWYFVIASAIILNHLNMNKVRNAINPSNH